jgi:hypothetical protein
MVFSPLLPKQLCRIQGENFSLIDHILTNVKYDSIGLAGTIVCGISDHFIYFTEILTPFIETKKTDKIIFRQLTPKKY